VPASTKATNPVDEFTVQIPVVELVYDFVPAPALAVDVTVGGEAVNTYDDEYEPESIVKVRRGTTVISSVADVDALYVPSPASFARIEQVPVFEAFAVSTEPDIEQYRMPSTTSYVVTPGEPSDTVVLRLVVPLTVTVVESAFTVAVLNVFPVVKGTMLP
jgi:hypothetical protein